MKKRSKPVFNGAENLAAFVYLCAISTVMMYLLCRDYVVICTIIMTVLSCGIYMLFYSLRSKKIMSFLAFMGLFAGVVLLCSSVSAVKGQIALIEFIYRTSDYFDVLLAAGTIGLFSLLLTYPVFYFSVRLPRRGFLLLPALAPLILSSRTIGTLPAGLIAFLAAGYFVAAMGVSHEEHPDENRYVEDSGARRQRLAAFGIFGAAAAVLLLLIPRSDRTPYSEYLDAARFSAKLYGRQSLSNFTQNAAPNMGNNQPADNTLFYVMTDAPRNVITQSFDKFRGRNGWTYSQNYTMGTSNWEYEQRLLNYNKLGADLKNAAKNGSLADFADELLKLPDTPAEKADSTYMTIQVVDGSNTAVVLHPSGTFAADIPGYNQLTYRNDVDEIYTKNPFGVNPTYYLQFYKNATDTDFARYLSGLSSNEYYALLEAAAKEGVIERETGRAFQNVRADADVYLNEMLDDAITPRIQALADQITAGLDNDYDKAIAIEKWFETDGFYYDLNFVPQEHTAEYFLFKSKRGICTDFATASTLLLRAAGIPARYTEGFLVKTDSASVDLYGRYTVKADQAHAFATAYIPGGGWLEIDGTKYATVVSAGKRVQRVIFLAAAVLAVIAILVVIFRKKLSELWFRLRYGFMNSSRKIRAVYLRTRRLACEISGADPKSTTSGEVRRVISRVLSLNKEACDITEAADALLYGGGPRNADPKRLLRDYRSIRKAAEARK